MSASAPNELSPGRRGKGRDQRLQAFDKTTKLKVQLDQNRRLTGPTRPSRETP